MAPTGSRWCDSVSLITRFQIELASALASQPTTEDTIAPTSDNQNSTPRLSNENKTIIWPTNGSEDSAIAPSSESVVSTTNDSDDAASLSSYESLNVAICSSSTSDKPVKWKLVRKHDKNLDRGDFSLSNLNNRTAWGAAIDIGKLNLSVLNTQMLKIRKLQLSGNTCTVFLDRKTAFQAYFAAAEALPHGDDNRPRKLHQIRHVVRDQASNSGGGEMRRVRSEFCVAMLSQLLQLSPTEDPTLFIGTVTLFAMEHQSG